MKRYASKMVLLLTASLITACSAWTGGIQLEDNQTGEAVAGIRGQLRISGDEEAISGFVLPVKETFEEENRGTTIDIVRNRPEDELAGLLRGDIDAIVSVHPLTDLVRIAKEQQVTVDPSILQSATVGKSDLVIFLNSKNSVRKITRKQLRGIFSGKLTNWKQLNGDNRRIVVVWDSAAAAENEHFAREVLGGAPLTPKMLAVDNFEEVRKRVMETPGAIGVAPAALKMAGLKVPNAPMASSRVIVITKGEPTQAVKNLTEILKDLEMLE